MFRSKVMIPALLVAAGLFAFTATAKADPYHHHHLNHGPVVKPSSGFSIGINIGAPVRPYPVYTAPVIVQPVYPTYTVFYRDCAASPWVFYTSYQSHRFAHEVANQLRFRGYDAYVSHR